MAHQEWYCNAPSLHARLTGDISDECVIEALKEMDGWRRQPDRESGHKAEPMSIQLDLVDAVHIAPSAAVLLCLALAMTAADISLTVKLPSDMRFESFLQNSGLLTSIKAAVPHCRIDGGRNLASADSDILPFPSMFFWESSTGAASDHIHEVLESAKHSARTVQMARTIVSHLVDNAIRHGGTSSALIAISTAKPHQANRVSDIQLIVADTGKGITELGDADMNPHPLFEPWPVTSREHDGPNPKRGLYKTARLLSSRGGDITVRSGFNIVERTSRGGQDIVTLTTSDRAISGTIVHVRIPRRASNLPLHHSLSPDPSTIDFVSGPDTPSDFGDFFQRLSNTGESGDLVVVDCRALDHLSQGDWFDLLCHAASNSSRVVPILMNLSLTDQDLLLMGDAVNRRLELECTEKGSTVRDEYSPVGLLGTRFTALYWAGIAPAAAQALSSGRELEATAWEQIPYCLIRPTPRRTTRGMPASSCEPRITPSLLAATSKRYLVNLLQAGATYPDGDYFVTQSLATTSRLLDVLGLLEAGSIPIEVIARLLTTQLEAILPSAEPTELTILYEMLLPRQFVTRLAELLTFNEAERARLIPVDSRDLDNGRYLHLPKGTPTVVLSRGRAEGDTIRSFAALALRQGADLRATLAILDGNPQGKFIQLFGEGYPFLSAIEVPTVATPHRRGIPSFVEAATRVAASDDDRVMLEVLSLLSEAGALKLGHFAGSEDRHFTFVVDHSVALASPALRAFISKQIGPLLPANGGDSGYLYSGPDSWPGEPSWSFAQLVGTFTSHKIVYPWNDFVTSDESITNGQCATFLIWSAITGNSIWRVLETAASRSYRHVNLIVLFSMLPEREQSRFEAIATIRIAGTDLRVSTHFLARVPFRAFPPARCPVCTQKSLTSDGGDRSRLSAEVRRSDQMLELSTWNNIDDTSAPDPLAIAYNGVDDMTLPAALCRLDLEVASRSLEDAWAVAQRWLEWLEDRDTTRIAGLCTLLIVEPKWLRVIPFRNQHYRVALQRVLEVILLSPAVPPDHAPLQVRALRALRLVSKSAFVRLSGRLLVQWAQDRVLFPLTVALLHSILDRTYVRHSPIVGEIASISIQVQSALAASNLLRAHNDELTALVKRSAEMRKNTSKSSASHWALETALREVAQQYCGHYWTQTIKAADPDGFADDPRKVLYHWTELRKDMELKLIPVVTKLRPRLLGTTTLQTHNAELDELLPEQEPLRSLNHAIDLMGKGRNSAAWSASNLKAIHNTLRALISVRYDDDKNAIDSVLGEAVALLSTDLFAVCEAIRNVADGCLRLLMPTPAYARDCRINIPDSHLAFVIRRVVENAIEHGGIRSQFEIGFYEDEAHAWSHLTFTTTGTQQPRERTNRPGPGGLIEMRSLLSDYCEVKWDSKTTINEQGIRSCQFWVNIVIMETI